MDRANLVVNPMSGRKLVFRCRSSAKPIFIAAETSNMLDVTSYQNANAQSKFECLLAESVDAYTSMRNVHARNSSEMNCRLSILIKAAAGSRTLRPFRTPSEQPA